MNDTIYGIPTIAIGSRAAELNVTTLRELAELVFGIPQEGMDTVTLSMLGDGLYQLNATTGAMLSVALVNDNLLNDTIRQTTQRKKADWMKEGF